MVRKYVGISVACLVTSPSISCFVQSWQILIIKTSVHRQQCWSNSGHVVSGIYFTGLFIVIQCFLLFFTFYVFERQRDRERDRDRDESGRESACLLVSLLKYLQQPWVGHAGARNWKLNVVSPVGGRDPATCCLPGPAPAGG